MFINPKIAIENGWITHPECTTLQDWIDRDFLSPNAIDFTLDRLFNIDDSKPFVLLEDNTKLHRGGEEIKPSLVYLPNINPKKFTENKDMFILDSGVVYDGMSNMFLNVPEGVACVLVVRSTLNRNGLFLTSGLYDSKYEGCIGYALHNRSNATAYIEPSGRVGQVIFVESSNFGVYSGGYNHQQGTHWSDK